jgi:hypothetical protein
MTMSTDIKFSTANFKAKHSCKVLTLMEFFSIFHVLSDNVRFEGFSDPQFLFRGSKRPLPKMCRTNEKAKNIYLFCFAQMLKFSQNNYGNATNNEWRSKYLCIGVKLGFAGPLVGLQTMIAFPVIRSFGAFIPEHAAKSP